MAQVSFAQRPTRLAAAFCIAVVVWMVFIYSPNQAALPFEPKSNQVPVGIAPAPENEKPKLVENAHKLPDADAFLQHFKAVTHLPGMSMAEAKSGCNWLAPWDVNFQYDELHEWVVHDRTDQELQMRRRQWHDFIESGLIPWEQYRNHFQEDRGIVIVAGNEKSLKRVRVVLNALAALDSKLAIELHYWGDEMNEESKQNISAMWPKMYYNDLSEPSKQNIIRTHRNGFGLINYQMKTAAVMNSRFAEPLLLDADNIPVIDPEELYDTPVYKEYGALFWPDIARTRPNNPAWAITNTKCRTDEYEQESGQLIVDKRRYFYHIQLAAWMNNNAGDYYEKFLLGDKDTFRFAWHALKTQYGFPAKWLTSVGTVSPDGYYCGHTFAQHHPDGRVAFLHGGLLKTIPSETLKWLREERGGIFQVYKRSEFDEKHVVNVNVRIKWDGAEYLPNRPENLQIASCTDMFDVQPRPLDEIVPGFERKFEEYGGYWKLDDPMR
jgi:alpha 1,2-mannosyltransferase